MQDPVQNLPPLREVIKALKLSAKKSLGQNFLLDLNLTGKIARSAGDLSTKTVIEIGPGPGGLTRALLLEEAQKVIAIEKDPRCHEALQDLVVAANGRLELREEDAKTVDYLNLAENGYLIIANLPYNIATHLLINWITLSGWPLPWSKMVLMFQREVAERIVAPVSNSAYSRLSVLSQSLTTPRILFNIPPQAFSPPPKVTSTVVEFTPNMSPPDCDLEDLQRVTSAAFGQRRKMLRSSLKSLTANPLELLEKSEIDPTDRAENLTVEQYCMLAKNLSQ